jgi:hypothetical protein
MKEQPLVDNRYLLEKFPGKGGWTYALIPEILQDKHSHFGWVRVKGTIDGVEINSYHLMPTGNGHLMLAVKAAIRKKIGKEQGDWVHVVLYPDNAPVEIPDELLVCLSDVPEALNRFNTLNEGEKKQIIEWIYEAKKEQTRIDRMARTINKLIGIG